jgi:hypothetical protein
MDVAKQNTGVGAGYSHTWIGDRWIFRGNVMVKDNIFLILAV